MPWVFVYTRCHMTRDEVIEEYCKIGALVFHTKGDYSEPNDGFCSKCPNIANGHFQNTGRVIDFIRQAVTEKLLAEGYTKLHEVY